MNEKIKLSICVPTVRTNFHAALYQGISNSMAGLPFEVIFIGPNVNLPENLLNVSNIRTLRDFGCPSRALQLGSLIAQGEYYSYVSDDGTFLGEELGNTVRHLDEINEEKRIVNWTYTEGPGYLYGVDTRATNPQEWFRSKYHGDFKPLNGVEEQWIGINLFTMRTSYFHKLGGIDCRWETINYNLHDLAFRAIRDGATLDFSKNLVARFTAVPGGTPQRNIDNCPILNALKFNDLPLLQEVYGEKREIPINIDINNWKNTESVWSRKWK